MNERKTHVSAADTRPFRPEGNHALCPSLHQGITGSGQ